MVVVGVRMHACCFLLLELILNIFVPDDKPDASPHHFALTQAHAKRRESKVRLLVQSRF